MATTSISDRPTTSRGSGVRQPRRFNPKPVLALVLALAALSLLGSMIVPASSRQLALTPCSTGRPEIIIPVLDLSTSVIADGGADPSGLSYSETELLVDSLHASPCSTDDRFSVVFFADQAVELPPTLLSSRSIIISTLNRPPAAEIGGGTSIGAALDRAAATQSRFPEADVTVVLLSDMQSSESLDATLSELDPDRLHLISIGQYDPGYDSRFATVAALGRVEAGEVADAYQSAINHSRSQAALADSN